MTRGALIAAWLVFEIVVGTIVWQRITIPLVQQAAAAFTQPSSEATP